MIVTSKSNNIVKYIDSLKNKKYRNKYNKYVIEGIKMVEEIINSEGNAPEFVVYSAEILENIGMGERFLKCLDKINVSKEIKVIQVSKEIFENISSTETPQGVLAVVDKEEYDILELKENLEHNIEDKYIVIDKVQDPGNLGTIIRSAAGFGVKNVILIEGTVDAFSPKTVRSTMSALNKVKLYSVKENNLLEMVKLFKHHKYNITITSLEAEKYINEEKIDNKTVFVMGNEANGVSKTMLDSADKKVKIPMEKNLESFNVAVATSIVMYEQYIRGGKNAC